MVEVQTKTHATKPWTVYCSHCGGPMLVAPEHVRISVSCPHCGGSLEPWRVAPPSPADFRSPVEDRADARWAYRPTASHRNRWIAGSLGILLGYFGVHRFYLGFVGMGLVQLLLTVCSFGLLSPIVAVWAIIEGILCFAGGMRDADGLPLDG